MLYYIFLHISIALMYLQLPILASDSSSCYWPNGDLVSNDRPCDPSSSVSPCCARGSTCLSSGVCQFTDQKVTKLMRGSCTDKTWTATKCPRFCYGEFYSVIKLPFGRPRLKECKEPWSDWNRNYGQDVNSCGDSKYCCQEASNTTSCCENNNAFRLNANLIAQTSIASNAPAATSSTSPASSPSTSSPSTTSPTPAHSKNHTNTALAAGLGVPLGLAVIGAMLFALHKYNQSRRQRSEEAATLPSKESQNLQGGFSDSTLYPQQQPVEVQGYTQWEMATEKNLPEVPANEMASSRPELPGSRI